ncbi:hypothetical protein AVEN_23059-1 [Araneus ventricosus]|uniref:Uncharacterized protein n=1 Tax=Araneus ventricosus TaxID=182803 RepID=A0A4Y2IMJ1_ARAVE|nr:hypothetical protein AVEN_23059-1 [Araneus ventricosus]
MNPPLSPTGSFRFCERASLPFPRRITRYMTERAKWKIKELDFQTFRQQHSNSHRIFAKRSKCSFAKICSTKGKGNSHGNRPDLARSRLEYLSDGRCNNSSAEVGVLMAITGHDPTPPLGGNQSIAQYLSVHKDSFNNPPTNRRLEEAVVGDWPKMMKFKAFGFKKKPRFKPAVIGQNRDSSSLSHQTTEQGDSSESATTIAASSTVFSPSLSHKPRTLRP